MVGAPPPPPRNKKSVLIERKSATDIWADLGLQEMPDCYDSDSNVSGGSGLSDSDSENDVLSEKGKRSQTLILNPSAHETFDSHRCW